MSEENTVSDAKMIIEFLRFQVKELENQLKEENFFRIHNSFLVNINYVKNINKRVGYYCEMLNGAFLPIAKRRYQSFNTFINLLKN